MYVMCMYIYILHRRNETDVINIKYNFINSKIGQDNR